MAVNQPIAEGTYRVSDLCEELKLFLGEAFPEVWVQGEAQRVNRSRAGHVYFELVEKGHDHTIAAKLEAVIWARDMRFVDAQMKRAGVVLEDGVELRLFGGMDFYPPQGRTQLRVSRVDPDFLLGRVERQRRETLRRLAEQGLIERNRQLSLSPVPTRLALVTSVGSAAYHDFISTLEESGWRFQLEVVDTVVQGAGAAAAVATALTTADTLDVDAVVLIRGGGARSDLHAFDTLELATAIATCRRPVIVGLGHQIDESVADQVAHTSTKTPTGAAMFLVDQVNAVNSRVVELTRRIAVAASARVERDGRRLAHAGLRASRGLERISAAGSRLSEIQSRLQRTSARRVTDGMLRWQQLGRRLAPAASRRIAVSERDVRRLVRGIITASSGRVRVAGKQLGSYERLTAQLAPERLLARGFSIVRTDEGVTVRSQKQVEIGDRLVVRLIDGSLRTQVESKETENER